MYLVVSMLLQKSRELNKTHQLLTQSQKIQLLYQATLPSLQIRIATALLTASVMRQQYL